VVTNAEYAEFVRDGGYQRTALWLSAGWAVAQERGWACPLYWERDEDTPLGWRGFTLAGMQALRGEDPVCHVSYYEADAYARWRSLRDLPGARVPTEFEWEVVAPEPVDRGDAAFHGGACGGRDTRGFYGAVWQWTMSPYVGYPGYRASAGALGEYNGKFMSDQWVLRGSSIATAPGHTRRSYRNFFPADARWQFSGIRLAVDV
jgi:ergothioneine biosynthesis protein EgtB